MNKIVKIHGASGSGKTTAVRVLMEAASSMGIIHSTTGKVEAYNLVLPGLDHHVFVIGSYENNCGGVDTIPDYRDVLALLDRYHLLGGHVVFEGLLQSTYYGAMGDHSRKYGPEYVYAFLDTPKEVCVERVNSRRAANGTKTKFNPDNTRKKWDTIERLHARVEEMGHNVVTINHKAPILPQMMEILQR